MAVRLDNGEEDYSKFLQWPDIVSKEPEKVADWLKFLIGRGREEVITVLVELRESLSPFLSSIAQHPAWPAYMSSGLPVVLMEFASDPDLYAPTSRPKGYKVLTVSSHPLATYT